MRDLLLKYDARLDRKKALLLQWRHQGGGASESLDYLGVTAYKGDD